MKKLLSKLILPVAFSSILTLNSLDAKAQEVDSLTKEFIASYDSLKKELISSYQRYCKFDRYLSFKANYYDLDNDKKVDVKEFFFSDEKNVLKDKPSIYFFDFNKDGKFSEYWDFGENGLNGDEIHVFYDAEDKSFNL